MAVSGTCGEHLTWTLTDGTLTISGTGKMGPCVIDNRVCPPWNEYLDSIEKVYIQDGVASITDWAFGDCINLLFAHIPDSVTEIGECVFSGCKNLFGITIPAGVRAIKKHTFILCTGMTSVTIPASVTEIGDSAFGACNSLRHINYVGTEAQWKTIKIDMRNDANCPLLCRDYIHFAETVPSAGATNSAPSADAAAPAASGTCGEHLTWTFTGGKLTISGTGEMASGLDKKGVRTPWDEYRDRIQSVEIRNGVTGIGDFAFNNCSFLTSVSIPNSVACIGVFSFAGCTGLTEVKIPDGVTRIALAAFAGCTGLTNVSIPGSVTSLFGTFGSCTGLTNVSIPESITDIGNGTFSRCSNLHDVYYTGTEEQWKAVKIDMHNDPLANAVIHFAKASL